MNSKTDHPKLTIDAPVLLAVAILLTFALQRFIPLPFFPSLPSRILGAILFIGGFALGFPALRGMLRAKTTPNPHRPTTALVRNATYRFTRNPMYLGMALVYAGLAIGFDGPIAFALLPLVLIAIQTQVIAREERYLEAKFGDDSRRYKAEVRRWL